MGLVTPDGEGDQIYGVKAKGQLGLASVDANVLSFDLAQVYGYTLRYTLSAGGTLGVDAEASILYSATRRSLSTKIAVPTFKGSGYLESTWSLVSSDTPSSSLINLQPLMLLQ